MSGGILSCWETFHWVSLGMLISCCLPCFFALGNVISCGMLASHRSYSEVFVLSKDNFWKIFAKILKTTFSLHLPPVLVMCLSFDNSPLAIGGSTFTYFL